MLCAALAFGLIAPAVSQARPPTFYSAQPEVFAIGDLHGDYYAMVKILRAANLIDSNNQWIGGTKTFVQVGDQLDRGDTEKEILDLFESLIDQAERAGGQVLVLNGNHETMNVELDFRYVTSEGFRQFDDYYTGQTDGDVRALPSSQRGRAVAFKPNGPYARKLAEHNSIVQIGETVFVHGGITPSHADYGIDRINSEISAWMYGDTSEPWSIGGSGPLWNRDYGSTVSSSDCSQLQNTLDKLNAKRLVIAHTRQRTINQACDGRVWRVDVGMSSYYGGKLQALKITNDDLIQIVEENGQLTETGYGSGDGGNNCAKPSKPQLPVASNIGSASYRLSWSATSNAEKYQVQRWSESNAAWQNIAKTSATSYLISGEQRVKAYARVIGINDCDVSGTPSDWIEVTMATSGGGDSCPSGFTEYSGTIQSNGTAKLFEAGYYYSEPGVHELINIGRAVTMNLYQWDGSNWQLKSSSGSELSYEGLTGYYYPYLSGTANQRYCVCLNRP
jgi:hypothetical protein